MGIRYNEKAEIAKSVELYSHGIMSFESAILYASKNSDTVSIDQYDCDGCRNRIYINADQALELRDFLNRVLVD